MGVVGLTLFLLSLWRVLNRLLCCGFPFWSESDLRVGVESKLLTMSISTYTLCDLELESVWLLLMFSEDLAVLQRL